MDIAVFDFDETLVLENSLGLLFEYASGSRWYLVNALPAFWDFILKPGGFYELKLAIKKRVYRHCLLNKPLSILSKAGLYAGAKLTLNLVVIDKLREHASIGDKIVIATASPKEYVQSILTSLDLQCHHVIGTELISYSQSSADKDQLLLTGQLSSGECSRHQKWKCVKKYLDDSGLSANTSLVAYGNDPDDLVLLKNAKRGYVVCRSQITLLKR